MYIMVYNCICIYINSLVLYPYPCIPNRILENKKMQNIAKHNMYLRV